MNEEMEIVLWHISSHNPASWSQQLLWVEHSQIILRNSATISIPLLTLWDLHGDESDCSPSLIVCTDPLAHQWTTCPHYKAPSNVLYEWSTVPGQMGGGPS